MIRKSAGFTSRNRNVTISIGNATNFPCSGRPMGGTLRTVKRLQKLLCEIFSLSGRVRAAIAPSNVAAQPF